MVLANLASEMGAKNAVFSTDDMLSKFFKDDVDHALWADEDASYSRTIEIDLDLLAPLVACPHQVENVKSVAEVKGLKISQGLIGTCTNGRIEDLRVAASILKGKKIQKGFQLLITPASREIYLQAIKEGLAEIFLEAGANVLSPSCGPCLGTGQGIPADGINVISTANRNFLGRMGNKNASIYLASPATVAWSALAGEMVHPKAKRLEVVKHGRSEKKGIVEILPDDDRYHLGVWNYGDVDNMNTDQMFAGNLTYEVNSSEPEKIKPHLLKGFDGNFTERVSKGDMMLCGDNFGCGSSREHPAVGLAFAGVKAIIVKSVSRIFFRSAINQGLPIIVLPEAVEAYQPGDTVTVHFEKGEITISDMVYHFNPLPDKLLEILKSGGLVKWMLQTTKTES
jgi:3-isopropylmalate dehydratase small subunit